MRERSLVLIHDVTTRRTRGRERAWERTARAPGSGCVEAVETARRSASRIASYRSVSPRGSRVCIALERTGCRGICHFLD